MDKEDDSGKEDVEIQITFSTTEGKYEISEEVIDYLINNNLFWILGYPYRKK